MSITTPKLRGIMLSLLISLIVSSVLAHTVPDPVVGLVAGTPLYPTNNPSIQKNINDLRASNFTKVLLYCIHVYPNGNLNFHDPLLVVDGKYVGDAQWPNYLTQLKAEGSSVNQIIMMVGAFNDDFHAIQTLIQAQGTGPDSDLYKNFAVLKETFPQVDGLDFNDKDLFDNDILEQFALMLGQIGFKLSFSPIDQQDFWVNFLSSVESKSPGLFTTIHLDCFNSGAGNDPIAWQNAVTAVSPNTIVQAGMTTIGNTDNVIEKQFASWGAKGLTGGFIWIYDDILKSNRTAAELALAVQQGLEANPLLYEDF